MSEQMNETPLLEVRHLRKLFPAKSAFGTREKKFIKAVDDVSFTLNPRETLGVVGESGCGKSTMGRSVLRLIEPTDGEILYKGQDFKKASGQELRRMRAENADHFSGSLRVFKPAYDYRRDYCGTVEYSETVRL